VDLLKNDLNLRLEWRILCPGLSLEKILGEGGAKGGDNVIINCMVLSITTIY